MTATYDADIVVWSNEQARLIRAGRFDLLDWEHIADEIEDVGKSEQRELANCMAILLAHLLKWQYQPEQQGSSWLRTIKEQRNGIKRRIRKTPSLQASLNDPNWWADAWADAVTQAIAETGMDAFPEVCPWASDEVLGEDWLPMASSGVSPDWHGDILAEREAATERGEERFEDWDLVKTLLRKSIENKHD